jgi:23S rRNA pseudouridine1911/1915/1917 synthase
MRERDEFTITFEVGLEAEMMRLDVFLSEKDASMTRSHVKRMINEGAILVNDMQQKPGYRLKPADVVVLTARQPRPSKAEPENIPLSIIYEDEALLVVDKPPGMVVHPAVGNYHGTLVNALLFHCNDLSGIGGVIRPGIVHRLDKHTSGLIVIAKCDKVHTSLATQFKERLVSKRYKALVHGMMKDAQGSIELEIGRHPKDRKKMSAHSKRGRTSLTRWHVAERFQGATLLDVEIKTGRTHQIRVHLHAIGHPVIGDDTYGHSKRKIKEIRNPELRCILAGLERQALHAYRLGFRHPLDGRYMEFTSPVPEDIASVVRHLRDYAGAVVNKIC